MTNDLLALVLRANLVAAVAIGVVLLLRPVVTQRFGPRITYVLWAVAPVAALASLLPARRVVVAAGTAVGAIVERRAEAPPMAVPDVLVPDAVLTAAPTVDPAACVLAVWIAGAAVSLSLLALRQAAFRRALGTLRREGAHWRAEACGVGPAVVGAVFPRIVIPADFEQRFGPEERAVVLAHEEVHFRRGDPVVNALVALARALGWFNPAVHVAAHYVRLDQELACDAAVVERFPAGRRRYAEAMLKTQLAPMAAPLVCHWPARSARPMKQRIALLKQPPVAAGRRAAGFASVVALGLGVGVVAWAAQPARIEMAPPRPATTPVRGGDVMRTNATAAQADRSAAQAAQAAAEADRAAAQADRAAAKSDRAAAKAEAARAASERKRALGGRLVEAIDAGASDDIRALVQAGADVNHLERGDGTPLVQAARRGDASTARLLIQAGADVNKAAPGDGSPLIMAAVNRRLEMIELLVHAGADVNGVVPGDETPLINAARSGDVAVVAYLLDRGANPNLAVASDNWRGDVRSPLSMAANKAVEDLLRAHGAHR